MKVLKLALLMLFLGNYIGLYSQQVNIKKSAPQKGYEIGDVVKDFSLMNVDGKEVSLTSIADTKGYIVVFTSNVCPYALMYEDRLIELHNKMAPKGYPVVAINPNDITVEEGDSYEKMQVRAKDKDFPFVYLKDDKQTIYPQFGASKTPHIFLLDNNLTVQYIGAIDDNAQSAEDVKVKYVENAIAALEKGDTPDPNFTKAIGCSIKTKNSKGKKGGRRGPPSPEKMLERMDTNNDQKISKSEAKGRLAENFDKYDIDEDGFLSKKELSAMKPRGAGKPKN